MNNSIQFKNDIETITGETVNAEQFENINRIMSIKDAMENLHEATQSQILVIGRARINPFNLVDINTIKTIANSDRVAEAVEMVEAVGEFDIAESIHLEGEELDALYEEMCCESLEEQFELMK